MRFGHFKLVDVVVKASRSKKSAFPELISSVLNCTADGLGSVQILQKHPAGSVIIGLYLLNIDFSFCFSVF